MSEELETTEEIRAGYAFNRYSMETAHEEFDLWYAEEIRKAKEETWDKAYAKGQYEYWAYQISQGATEITFNPYREEKND